jgi:hypothetical protein
MTFFDAAGLFLAEHFPPLVVIFVLAGILAAGLTFSFPVEPKRGDDL